MSDINQEILLAIGRLEGKVDTLMSSVADNEKAATDRMNRIDDDIEDIRKDVKELEKSWAKLVGAAGVVGAIVAAVVDLIFRKF